MLVFDKEDTQSDAWAWACRKLAGRSSGCGPELSHSKSHSSNSSASSPTEPRRHHQYFLVRSFQPDAVQLKMADIDPNLIVIDRRSNRARDADALCR